MTNPKDPQAELHKLFRQICLRWGENQPHADPYHAYDEIYEEFAPKFNALFQAHQQELLTEFLGELPPKDYPDKLATNFMKGRVSGHNAALIKVVSAIERLINTGKLDNSNPPTQKLDKSEHLREGLHGQISS